jgi:hypothetical protein
MQRAEFGFGHEVSSSFLWEARFQVWLPSKLAGNARLFEAIPGGTAGPLSNRCI